MWDLNCPCPSCPHFPSYFSQEISFYEQWARNKRPGLIFRHKATFINSKKQGTTELSRICKLNTDQTYIYTKHIVKLLEKAPLAPSRKRNCLVFGVEQTQGASSDPLPHKVKVSIWEPLHREVRLDGCSGSSSDVWTSCGICVGALTSPPRLLFLTWVQRCSLGPAPRVLPIDSRYRPPTRHTTWAGL